MVQTDIRKTFLLFVRLGLGHYIDVFPPNIEWPAIQTLAEMQGLYAIVLDGIEKLPSTLRPPQEMLLEWIGEVLQGYEYRYEQYCKAISELAGFYNNHGYKMMVLKGYACSLNWPKPSHRPCGDIDIWLFGKQKEADAILTREKGIEIDTNHHHHTVFYYGDFMVENHYDFDNIHARKSNAKIEVLFKELAQDSTHFVDLKGEKIYLPSPNLHALFLVRHTVAHFVGSNITIRQLLDWAFFAKKYTKEIDWIWLNGVLGDYHMKEFFNVMNAICIEDLGFDASIFHGVQFNPALKDRILEDILEPTFDSEEPARLIPRLVFKYRRWKANAWKHELCYNESLSSAFWSGIWNHILKPASI